MTDAELIKFGKDVRKLAENPFHGNLKKLGGSGSEGKQACGSKR